MAGMKDTLGDLLYPESPGFKKAGTSEAAARSVAGRAPGLRERALKAVKAAGAAGLTADECAAALGATVLAVRPRFTELLEKGMIRETQRLRRNESGRMARVMVAA